MSDLVSDLRQVVAQDLKAFVMIEEVAKVIGAWTKDGNALQREVTLEFIENGFAAGLGIETGQLGDLGRRLAADRAVEKAELDREEA